MKKRNFLWSLFTMLMATTLSMGFVSCGPEDDDTPEPAPVYDEYDVTGTTWSTTSSYSDGTKETIQIKFSVSTAIFTYTYSYENQSYSETYNYTYRRSNNLVVMTPQEAGNATMEGEIVNSIKMIVTNMSSKSQFEFYKQ